MNGQARLRRFAALVQRAPHEIELDAAALSLGDWDAAPEDDRIASGRRQLDALAERVRRSAGADPDEDAAVRAVSRVLFVEDGFTGNAADYYDPRNSFLTDVLRRRLGIPISLTVLYVEVARRVGVDAQAIGLPGHVVVRAPLGGGALMLDAFCGSALDDAGVLALVRRSAGPDAVVEPAMLAPMTTPQILARMLRNLAGIYGRDTDLFRSIEVLERLALLDPDSARLASDLDRLRARAASIN